MQYLTYQPKGSVPLRSPPTVLDVSPDGNHLAAGDGAGGVYIWGLGDLELYHLLPSCNDRGYSVTSLTWFDRDFIVYGRQNGLLAVAQLDYVMSFLFSFMYG